MGQSDLNGELLFLHSNMHKWDMRLPRKFHMHYQRRWVKMLPGGKLLQKLRWVVCLGGFAAKNDNMTDKFGPIPKQERVINCPLVCHTSSTHRS